MAATVREGFLCAGISEDELRYSCTAFISKDDMANLHLQGSLSTNGTRNFKELVVYASQQLLQVLTRICSGLVEE